MTSDRGDIRVQWSAHREDDVSRLQWEYDVVERPFCEQLQGIGWPWLEGDVDVPELT